MGRKRKGRRIPLLIVPAVAVLTYAASYLFFSRTQTGHDIALQIVRANTPTFELITSGQTLLQTTYTALSFLAMIGSILVSTVMYRYWSKAEQMMGQRSR